MLQSKYLTIVRSSIVSSQLQQMTVIQRNRYSLFPHRWGSGKTVLFFPLPPSMLEVPSWRDDLPIQTVSSFSLHFRLFPIQFVPYSYKCEHFLTTEVCSTFIIKNAIVHSTSTVRLRVSIWIHNNCSKPLILYSWHIFKIQNDLNKYILN